MASKKQKNYANYKSSGNDSLKAKFAKTRKSLQNLISKIKKTVLAKEV